MAKVLTSFLVGLGIDYDNKGEKEAEKGLDSVKSQALQVGKVLAGAFGAKKLTFDFAEANDRLGKFVEVYGGSVSDIRALGIALEKEGGSFDSIFSNLANLEQMRAGLLVGETGAYEQAAIAGLDPSIITNASNAQDAFERLSDAFAGMSREQRLNAGNALGFDDATIRLLAGGSLELNRIIEQQQKIRNVTAGMTQDAAEFNDAWIDMTEAFGQLGDTVSTKVLPPLTDLMNLTTELLTSNKEWTDDLLVGLGAVAVSLGVVKTGMAALKLGKVLGGPGGMANAAGCGCGIGGPGGKGGKSPMIGEGRNLIGRAGAVGLAAWGGYEVGSVLYEQVLPQVVKDGAGNLTTSFMAALGNEEAKATLDRMKAYRLSTGEIPAQMDHASRRRESRTENRSSQTMNQNVNVTLELDGDVLTRKVIEVGERNNQTTLNDLQTTDEG